MPPQAPLVRATTNTSTGESSKSGSSGHSGGAQAKITRSTGRGGSGNIKRTASEAPVTHTIRDLAAIRGREAPTVIASSSKKLVSGRGGSGNIRGLGYLKSSKTAALVVQYEGPIRNYERDIIAASAARRLANIGASGRGGSGNNYDKKAKRSKVADTCSQQSRSSSSASRAESSLGSIPETDSQHSADSGPSSSRPPRKLMSRGFMSKLKMGKGKKVKNAQADLARPMVPDWPSTSDAASVIAVRSPSVWLLQDYPSSTASISEAESFLFSDTGTVDSTFATQSLNTEDEDEEEEHRRRLGLTLIEEAEEEDDESIYLAYARDDNCGQEDEVDPEYDHRQMDTISEASEDCLSDADSHSDVEDGVSTCIHAVGLGLYDATAQSDSEPSTPQASQPLPTAHRTLAASAYRSPVTPPHLNQVNADDEDDVDPSLRVMRARYSMAQYYRSSPTPSHTQSVREVDFPPSPALPHGLLPALTPSSSSSMDTYARVSRTSPFCDTGDVKQQPLPSTSGANSAVPNPAVGDRHSYHLPTRWTPDSPGRDRLPSSPDHLQAAPTSARRQSVSRISLLSTSDFAANGDTSEELPPYTPHDMRFNSPPVRVRPLPSVPDTSAVERLLNLPSVPHDMPRGPRRPPRLTSRQYEPADLHHQLAAEHPPWPSPPTSPPRHGTLPAHAYS